MAASTKTVVIQKKIFGSDIGPTDLTKQTTLTISCEELDDIVKIVKSLEESDLLRKGVDETRKNEAKGPRGGFTRILLVTLGPSLLGNLLTGNGILRAAEGTISADQDF